MNPIADRFHNAPIAKTIGFDVSCNPANEVEVSLSVSSHLWNPMGKLQGGVMSILADAAMGIAFGRELSPDCEFSTIDFSISHMRPVTRGWLRAIGRVVQRGVSVGFLECEIYLYRDQIAYQTHSASAETEGGKLVATATCSCMTTPAIHRPPNHRDKE